MFPSVMDKKELHLSTKIPLYLAIYTYKRALYFRIKALAAANNCLELQVIDVSFCHELSLSIKSRSKSWYLTVYCRLDSETPEPKPPKGSLPVAPFQVWISRVSSSSFSPTRTLGPCVLESLFKKGTTNWTSLDFAAVGLKLWQWQAWQGKLDRKTRLLVIVTWALYDDCEIEIQLILCPGHNPSLDVTLVFPRNGAVTHSGSCCLIMGRFCRGHFQVCFWKSRLMRPVLEFGP